MPSNFQITEVQQLVAKVATLGDALSSSLDRCSELRAVVEAQQVTITQLNEELAEFTSTKGDEA